MIFDIDKWERIKNRHKDAVQAFRSASDDWQFEKDNFVKIAIFFQQNFPPSNPDYAEVDQAISVLRRMDPKDISAINLKAKETLELAKDKTSHRQHLTGLLENLIIMKRAEARKELAAEVQQNTIKCFPVLDEFARKHIKLLLSPDPTPGTDYPTTMDSYSESL
jgi:hypothetical protein